MIDFWAPIFFFLATIGEIALLYYVIRNTNSLKYRMVYTVGIIACSLALFFGVRSANAEEAVAISPAQSTRAEYILEKVKEADLVCSQVSLAATIESEVSPSKKGKPPEITKRIVERPVALCAWSEVTKTWHVIHVHLSYPVPQAYITCVRAAPTLEDRKQCILPFFVVTPGYQVEHLRGYGIPRFIVNVYKEEIATIQHGDEKRVIPMRGEKLTVYRTRHMWFDDEVLASGDVDRIVATSSAINYTPYHPDFYDEDLVTLGTQFLFEKVRDVQRELGLDPSDPASVRSHAFPARTLADAVPWEIPMSLAIIEQIDDKTFQANKKRTVEGVLIEYAINREESFRWAQSGASAIGPLQFTEAGGNGTYSAMVRGYPEARLEQSFQIGARDLGNVLKAAIALIDHEVATFPQIKPTYEKEPKLGGAFPVARYNGGPSAGIALYEWLKKNKMNITQQTIVLPQALKMKKTEHCPCKNTAVRKGKKPRIATHIVVNTETPGYLVKYLYLLNYLADQDLE